MNLVCLKHMCYLCPSWVRTSQFLFKPIMTSKTMALSLTIDLENVHGAIPIPFYRKTMIMLSIKGTFQLFTAPPHPTYPRLWRSNRSKPLEVQEWAESHSASQPTRSCMHPMVLKSERALHKPQVLHKVHSVQGAAGCLHVLCLDWILKLAFILIARQVLLSDRNT